MKRFAPWATLLLFNAFAFGMLGLYQTSHAGSPGGSPPFANTSESRLEMVEQLKEIRDLLKEQNALLRSGEVKVIVTELPKAGVVQAQADGAADPAPVEPAHQSKNQSDAMSRYGRKSGFTLLELLLVVAIIGILAVLLIPSSQPNLCDQLDSTAHIVATELAYGSSLAVSNNDKYRFTFDQKNNRFYLQYAGANQALQTLPITAFSSPGDPATQHIIDFDDLPHVGPTVQLAAVASTGNAVSPVTTLDFSALGGTVSATPTTIWLSAGSGDGTRYITVTVNPVTGLATVGAFSASGPPPAAVTSY